MSYRIVLKDAYKNYTWDQDKTLAPAQTVKRLREKLKELDLNILEGTMSEITGSDLDIGH